MSTTTKTTMSFEEAVTELANEDGVAHLLSIPGVREHVSEYYNNAAIELVKESEEESKVLILINDSDYYSDDDGSIIELLCNDFTWLDATSPANGVSRAGGFAWSWDPEDDDREHGHATTIIACAKPPKNCNPDQLETHVERVTTKLQADLESKGFKVEYY